MNITTFLNSLDRVRANGKGKWQAACPAHSDRSPSLAVKEASNGNILINCFSGCTPDEITSAMGLQMRDLFADDNFYTRTTTGPSRTELEKALVHELYVLQVAIGMRRDREPIHPEDKDREQLAVKRINALLKEIYH